MAVEKKYSNKEGTTTVKMRDDGVDEGVSSPSLQSHSEQLMLSQ